MDISGKLLSDARIDRDYAALLIVSAIVAALGLEQNSVATIIGAMVVAPLMLPIRALGYGVLRLDQKMIAASLQNLVFSLGVTLAIGVIVGLSARRPEFGSEILSRTSVTFLGLGVAVAGGTLSGLSRALGESRITDALVGVGISVSLVPPLGVAGIMFAYGHWFEGLGALTLFFTNLVGIALACAVVFWITGHASQQLWRTATGFAIFAAAVATISPALAQAGYRARQLARIESFLAEHGKEYLPSIVAIESTQISWKAEPFDLITTVRAPVAPSRDQVRRLNDVVNRETSANYRLNVVVDPVTTILP